MDIHIVLPRNAAEGDDPLRADTRLQNLQHIGLAGIGGVDLQVGIALIFRRRIQHHPHPAAELLLNSPGNLLGMVGPGQRHDVEHLLPFGVIAEALAGVIAVGRAAEVLKHIPLRIVAELAVVNEQGIVPQHIHKGVGALRFNDSFHLNRRQLLQGEHVQIPVFPDVIEHRAVHGNHRQLQVDAS